MTWRPRWLLRLVCLMVLPATALPVRPVWCTSAQSDMTEPVPLAQDEIVRGKAMFAVMGGSDTYDTVGNLGATFRIGNLLGGDLYFFADMLTWIENPSASEFQPRRIVYTLEAGYTPKAVENRTTLFVKHQSFHDVDSFDGMDESYELYGLRYRVREEPHVWLRIGKYLNRTVVDYDWDYIVGLQSDIGTMGNNLLYGFALLHYVTEDGSSGRDGFVDWALETGLDFQNSITLFLRNEQLHDVDRFAGITDTYTTLGIKYEW